MVVESSLLFFAYLIGSIPTGAILSRIYGNVDIRKEGSGNIGAANVYRTLGKIIGVFTFLGDVLKGTAPVLISFWLLDGAHREIWISLTALMVLVGHCYPLFLKFQGGKGVATALGAFLAIDPWVIPGAFIIFILVYYKWKYVSLGSLLATGSVPVLVAFSSASRIYVFLATVFTIFIFYRHRENIKRLWQGREIKV